MAKKGVFGYFGLVIMAIVVFCVIYYFKVIIKGITFIVTIGFFGYILIMILIFDFLLIRWAFNKLIEEIQRIRLGLMVNEIKLIFTTILLVTQLVVFYYVINYFA